MRTKDLIHILIVFGLDIWKPVRTKNLIGSYIDCYRFSAWIFRNPCELRILYVLLLFFGLDIWKPVRTKDLIRILIVFRLGYLETRAK